jgi:hypothetical protein
MLWLLVSLISNVLFFWGISKTFTKYFKTSFARSTNNPGIFTCIPSLAKIPLKVHNQDRREG